VNLLNREFDIDLYREAMIETGEDRRAERIAEKMLKKGMSKEFVMENTELSLEKVEKIIKRINKV